ncbi:MAG: IS1634 family transposase [Endozoicomonadaceae bacterium]|nr:IS1634 family transposase [Endozoicomonadaceae bacterium]
MKKLTQQKYSKTNKEKVAYKVKNLDHLGLIAAQFDHLGLVELIDKTISQDKEKRNVSLGQAIKAMVINGLGFANHTLYMMPEFFEDKPVDRLIGQGIEASDLNQNLFGRALEDIFEFDPTQLYSILSTHTVKQLGLPCRNVHIDTSSIHVDGDYNSHEEPVEGVIHITKGYSRDHRPDLNQVGLELIVENQAGIPLIMESLSGNKNDKSAFSEAVTTHIKQLQGSLGVEYLIGDSALYTAESIKKMDSIFWISRVPEVLKDAKWVIEEVSSDLMIDLTTESYCSVCMTYADVQQRWVVYYSPEAYQRALNSVNKQFLKLSSTDLKAFKKLTQQEFSCPEDAEKMLEQLKKKLKVTHIDDISIEKKERFNKKGRPSKEAQPDYYIWQIEGAIASVIEEREVRLRRKSCFILATNQLDREQLSEEELIQRYKKDQQKVERGFRFLKDPQFLAATLFLKKPERIMALLMIMTLSLLIYATIEHRIRGLLNEKNETFPDQKGKPTKKPTTRWIFQSFSGIHVLSINQNQVLILNLKEKHSIILRLMGENFQKIYSEN